MNPVCRDSVNRCGFASIGLDLTLLAVALDGARREPDNFTGFLQACPGGAGLLDQRDHFLALLEVDFSSSRSSKSA